MKTIGVVGTLILVFFWSCSSFFNGEASDKVIAQVKNKKLLLSELEMSIPTNLTEIDSISFAQNYIEKWVKNMLLLEKAELNLDKGTQKGIEVMMENYRTSLLLYKYQQMIIQQKLDTIITENQIDTYYKQHAGNFKLDSAVVKAVFVQVPKSLYDRYKIKSWMQSNEDKDIAALEDYCYQNARNFNMGNEWRYFGDILSGIPRKIDNRDAFLKNNNFLETTDSIYAYYLSVFEYKITNDTSPLEFVKPKIHDILLNHRKVQLIKDLESNIYNDAVDQKKFKILTN